MTTEPNTIDTAPPPDGRPAVSNPISLPALPRSLGLKMILILVLTLIMAIPVAFIGAVSFERSSRAGEVTREVSQTYGGAQTLMGPIIVVPFTRPLDNGLSEGGDYIVSANSGAAEFAGVGVEEKSRSLYKVPVYSLDGKLSAELPKLADMLPRDAGYDFDLDAAKLVVGLGDVTGLQSDVTLSAGSQTLTFEPFTRNRPRYVPPVTRRDEFGKMEVIRPATGTRESLFHGLEGSGMTLLSVPAAELLQRGGSVTANMQLTGAERLSVVPYARSTTLEVSSDWPHPGFQGRFPPSSREITDAGFSASWSVPYLRRGIPAQGKASELAELTRGGQAMGVAFVTPLNPYQTVNRALKYAVLFIGLVFLAYFLMETLLGVRVHPAQYLLIGLAQAVFYLLLLAFSEQVGFTIAFLGSAAATVALTALYAGAVFGRNVTWKAAGVFAGVYGLLFVLMRIQDFALMVGALVSFVAIAATLYLTRNLDWYGGKGNGSAGA